MSTRKSVLLRLDPHVHDALAKWAADELRSTNAQIEFLLRRALAEAGRMPGAAARMRGRGRPRTGAAGETRDAGEDAVTREEGDTADNAGAGDGTHTADGPAGPMGTRRPGRA